MKKALVTGIENFIDGHLGVNLIKGFGVEASFQ